MEKMEAPTEVALQEEQQEVLVVEEDNTPLPSSFHCTITKEIL